MGFAHNNCGGFCCKAGQGSFARLWDEMPERYLWHEAKERDIRDFLNRDVSILVDRRGGGTRRPLTMEAFRRRMLEGESSNVEELGGCGCFAGEAE
jgi:hypothetical protein